MKIQMTDPQNRLSTVEVLGSTGATITAKMMEPFAFSMMMTRNDDEKVKR